MTSAFLPPILWLVVTTGEPPAAPALPPAEGLDLAAPTPAPTKGPANGSSNLTASPSSEISKPSQPRRLTYFGVHRAFGTLALGSFASALVIGAATGNLGKLMDENRCCPSGGERVQPWRNIDRGLVDVGIVSYAAAASMALFNLTVREPPSDGDTRVAHWPHRWLAIGHGAAFTTSAITGVIMATSQSDSPERFAAAARVHVASNILLVPLLAMAMADILFE